MAVDFYEGKLYYWLTHDGPQRLIALDVKNIARSKSMSFGAVEYCLHAFKSGASVFFECPPPNLSPPHHLSFRFSVESEASRHSFA